MSYSKLIHEYLDEGLPEVQEESLFAELAADSLLRAEFNKQVQLHLLAQNDMNSITPPIDITNGVFRSLGFAIPTPVPVDPTPKSHARFSKYGMTALLFILASVLPVSVYYTYDNYFADNSLTAGFDHNLNNAANNSTALQSNIPVMSSESLDDQNANNVTSGSIEGRNSSNSVSNNGKIRHNKFASNQVNYTMNNASTNSTVNKLNSDAFLDNIKSVHSNETNGTSLYASAKFESSDNGYTHDFNSRYKIGNISGSSQNFPDQNISSRAFALPFEDNYSIFDNLTIDNTQFAVVVKGISIESALPSKQAGSFNLQDNINVAAFYKLDAYNAIGVEFGREQFAQEFTRIIAGKEHQQFQTPSIYWVGITYRLIVPDWAIMNRIIPYAQLSAGINNIGGALFKIQPGLEWRMGKNLSFVLAGDFSSLLYNYDNVIYDSEKFGFVYGVNVNF